MLDRLANHPVLAQRPVIKQFMKFAVVGGINTVIDYLIFSALIYLLHVHYLAANIVSFSVAVTNSYILNRRWTFRRGSQQWRSEAAKFFIINIIALGISELLLHLFVERLHVSELLAKAMAIIVVLFWNFVGTRFWAFRGGASSLPG